ncbi:MAG: PEP-CTERM sorting domain-containing protein [Pyrinomonadaceae bacterium]|nr:PEP-CTERM sorting domain-containing protein [Pyrinomonadaceae bacterium]
MSTPRKANLNQALHSRIVFWFFLTLLLLWPAQQVNADEIAIWNFNDSDLAVDHGAGALTTNFNLVNLVFTLGGTSTNARQGDVAGQSMTLQGGTSNANNGRFLNLDVSTVGFNSIVISFATQGTSTGFTSNQFQYSLDGVGFVNFGAPYTPPLTFGLVSFDLSTISGVNDNPNAAFRIVFNGATSASGNNRIDNLVVEGRPIATPIPEPASILLLSLGLTGTLATKIKVWRTKPGRRRD